MERVAHPDHRKESRRAAAVSRGLGYRLDRLLCCRGDAQAHECSRVLNVGDIGVVICCVNHQHKADCTPIISNRVASKPRLGPKAGLLLFQQPGQR